MSFYRLICICLTPFISFCVTRYFSLTVLFARLLLKEYGRHLARIATTLFEAMAKDLDLDPKQSQSYLAESTGFVRVYRYPSGSMADEAWGMIAHTDSSVLSIVSQDQVGGLEIFKDNKWLLVNPIPNTLIIHVGDMMQVYKILLDFNFFSAFISYYFVIIF